MIDNFGLMDAYSLLEGGASLAIIEENKRISLHHGKGIGPLVDLIEEGEDLSDCLLVDKVTGKAAALLCVLLKVKKLYTILLSEQAIPVLEKAGVSYQYGSLVPHILNAKKDGMCPMEQAVEDIDDPEEAYPILKERLLQMRNKMKGNK